MARLSELAEDYRRSAALLRMGLEDAKERLRTMDGPERAELEGEMKLIRQMLKEVRDLRRLCEGYYTRSRSGTYTVSTLKAPRRDALK